MDDNAKNACSYQVDQDLLDARGINMTVEEVAGLSTTKYSERVHSLKLCNEDLAFLKGLRRRIKNRLASQNSRRRSVEHLRRLTRELRAVRACRRDALVERRALVRRRDAVRHKCVTLRRHLLQILEQRSDHTEVPSIEVNIESQPTKVIKKVTVAETKTPLLAECLKSDQHISVIVKNNMDREKLRQELEQEDDIYERVRQELQKEIHLRETVVIEDVARETLIIKEEVPDYDEITIEDDFEIQRSNFDKQRSDFDNQRSDFDTERSDYDTNRSNFEGQDMNFDDYNRNYESDSDSESFRDNYDVQSDLSKDIFECKIQKLVTKSVNHMFEKKVFAKTVFISNDTLSSNIKTVVLTEGSQENGVLNLSVKEGRRKSHGRKQSAPRRIACYTDCDDAVLDLKVKKEPQ